MACQLIKEYRSAGTCVLTHTHTHIHTHACTQVRLDLVNLPVCGLKMGAAAKWVHGGSSVAWVK